MSTFSYDPIKGTSDVWGEVQQKLDGLDDNQRRSAKIAISHMGGDDTARAVIFFTNDAKPSGSPEKILSSTWQYKDFTTGSDYDSMYQDCQNFLNDTLTDDQSYYARISMTNAGSHSSHLVVWYREMA